MGITKLLLQLCSLASFDLRPPYRYTFEGPQLFDIRFFQPNDTLSHSAAPYLITVFVLLFKVPDY
jgi:hypothetical protein